MKTDRFIELLSTNLEPVKKRRIWTALIAALFVGGAVAFCLMMATVGLRSQDSGGFDFGFLALKLLFTMSLIGIGTGLLIRLARPGQNGGKLWSLVILPFVTIGLAVLVSLKFENPTAWRPMILGAQWATCMYCIPLFAAVPFAVLIWGLRKGAATNLKSTGAVAGLVAGAVGAAVYAFHCSDDSLPFVAIWYSLLIGLCALVGAMLGPRLLRW